MNAREKWLKMIEDEATNRAESENEASGHCGPYGTDTADDYRSYVIEDFIAIGEAYIAMHAEIRKEATGV